MTAETTIHRMGNRVRRKGMYSKYRLGSIWFGSKAIDTTIKAKIGSKPDPEPNKGLDPGSPEPVSRTLTALVAG